jgi:hypothetical protein
VENFSAMPADAKISTLGNATKLKNLVTGETLEGRSPQSQFGGFRRGQAAENRITFTAHLPPHSYAVFAPETDLGNANAPAK